MPLEFKKREGSVFLSKAKLERKVNEGCDVLALVAVEKNEEVSEPPAIVL